MDELRSVDFKTLADIIFRNKNKYQYVSDEEKEASFFKLNRKFAIKYLKQAQFFNNKNVDRSAAMDIWFSKFYNNIIDVPAWYWATKQQSKDKAKSKFSGPDLKLFKEYHEITNKDIDFMIKHFEEVVDLEIKRIKKIKK